MQKIAAALVAFREECPNVAFDKTNPHFKSKFASLTGILKAIKPALDKSGLSVLQFPHSEWVSDRVCIGCRTVIIHSSGECIEHSWVLPPSKQDPQAGMAALTYARRGALGAALGLVIEEDDSGVDPSIAGAGQRAPRARSNPKLSPEERDKLKYAADIRIGELGDETITQTEVLKAVAKALGFAMPIEMDDFAKALSAVQSWEPGA